MDSAMIANCIIQCRPRRTEIADLGSKRFQAVIRGLDRNGNQAIPLVSGTKGAVMAKSIDAQPASGEDASTTAPIK